MKRDDCQDENQFDGRTYLYIRTHPEDNGYEPLPDGLPFWVSPDISIITPNGARGTEAIAGQVNYIEVIVTNNGGIIATDAFVEVFYGGPATGFVSTTAQKIGSQFVTVQGYSTSTVRIPWVPLPSQEGHLCLTARVSLLMPPDTFRDANTFDVRGDRHVAQRNIHIIKIKSSTDFSFDFNLVNPFVDLGEELILQTRFINANQIKDSVNEALGCCFTNFSNELFGQIKLEIEGKPTEINEKGECYVYIPHKSLIMARINVKRFEEVDNSCGKLHLLEIKLIAPRIESPIGGLWLLINP
ncbi:hypothetical protein [Bacillus mycoides]|uniref:hypothetical protein n=1 Tax=Bacillus mycoides TaxID=1405 RepID=UPI003F8D00CE